MSEWANPGRDEGTPPLLLRGVLALGGAAIGGYLFWGLIPSLLGVLTMPLARQERAWWIALLNATLLGGACHLACAVALLVPGRAAFRRAAVAATAGWVLLLPASGWIVLYGFAGRPEVWFIWAAPALTAALWLWHALRKGSHR